MFTPKGITDQLYAAGFDKVIRIDQIKEIFHIPRNLMTRQALPRVGAGCVSLEKLADFLYANQKFMAAMPSPRFVSASGLSLTHDDSKWNITVGGLYA